VTMISVAPVSSRRALGRIVCGIAPPGEPVLQM
jgi:hypothetical protein